MKKILSFFAAMLAAVAVSATPVALPATLDVSNVSFRSEGMPDFVIEAGQDYAGTYFDMGAHDSSNDTLLYAEWDVTIESINYNVAVDVYNTNSWRVQLYVLNQAGDTVKALRYKGSSGQKGQYAIGSIDMRDLAAGNYKVRAHAATAWSAMKLKDVIFEADYQGVSVALPGTLLPAYAELSAGASVTNHAIAFAPSTANNEYATWNVSFAAAGSFNVAIDITATNGHNYGVALLSADGQTEIGAVSEGAQKSDTGEKELGAIAVPAAGNYVVKLTNATQWSEAVLNKITFAAPAEPQTLYLKISSDWSYPAKYAIYYFNEGANGWSDFMTLVEGEDDIYVGSIPADFADDNIIFVRLNGEATTPNWNDKWSQTVNLTIPEDKDFFTVVSGGTGDQCNGTWSKYVAPVIPDIAWELNGGAMNPKGLASKEALWYQFVADFNACYNKNKELSFEGLTPVTANGLTYNIGIDNLLTETWGWKWLLDYVTDVTTAAIAAGQEYAAGKPVAAMSTEAMRRATVASFWASGQYTSWPGSADFSEAGKPENYLLAYRAMMMPESVDAEFTLVNPTKKGYTFAGWFNNAEFSGEALTSIPANFQGKLYAKWTALPAQQFYLKPGPWYYAANGEKFAMYAFEDGMPEYWSAFMSLAENETSIYTGTIPGGYTHVIFVRFGSASTNPSWSDNMWNQSEDLTIEADKDMYTITNQEPWSQETGSHKAEGAWSKYEYVAPAKFYILGTNGWEPETDLIRSDEDSYVLHLEAGYYEIKVLVDGTWATSKGYDDLTEVAAGLSKNEEFGNICFTLDADGDVTVTYTGEVFKLEGSFHVSGTAIDNAAVEAKVVKMIENGQIVIIRNGEKFNVQGQVIR